jgi:hypothetical protein
MKEAGINIVQRIINGLLLHSSFIDNLGLLNGKMGVSIFFYHLSRKTGNTIYEDYAGELIDEIYEGISSNTPLDFANGLAGIGWGIEYLVQNHFLEANTDEVLEETDKRLMQLIYHTPPDLGLCEGVLGVGAYLLKRIQNPAANDEKIQTLINKQLMIHLIIELDRRTQDVSGLIQEPSPEHHDTNTSQEGGKPDIKQRKPAIFDLTWDYPLLLIFLTEVFHLHLYNVKVIDILKRLILPLLKAENHPQFHSNRLLLALALTKLKYETNMLLCNARGNDNNFQQQGSSIRPLKDKLFTYEIINILDGRQDEWESSLGTDSYAVVESVISSLLCGINHATIAKELSPDCAFLKNGTMGISWIYQELFRFSENLLFKTEADYWINESFKREESDQGYAGFHIARENEGQAFGILNGLSGILLFINVNSTPSLLTGRRR